MGQYYMVILGDPHGLNCKVFDRTVDGEYTFAKLMEHSWLENPFVTAISEMLYKGPGRLAWVGDYAKDSDFEALKTNALFVPCCATVWGDGVKKHGVSSTDFTLDGKFLLNRETKQFVDMDAYKAASTDKNGWCIHPLPLLTALGNNRGGGDFYEGNVGFEFVGSWAWQLIAISDKPPADYTKFDVAFIERRERFMNA